MLERILARIVGFCVRYAGLIIISALLIAIGSGVYVGRHFAVNTEVSRLLSPDLPWRQREIAYRAAFPQQAESIIAVIDGDTPEGTTLASRALVGRLKKNQTLFRSVRDVGDDAFFRRSALLFLNDDQFDDRLKKLNSAAPLLRVLAPDRSLRGLAATLMAGLRGVQARQFTLDDMAGTLNMASATLESVLADQPKPFSWVNVLNGGRVKPEDARHLIQIVPVLDYSALEPGRAATTEVRKAANDLDLPSVFHARLRLTGPVPISDEEFSTLQQGAALNAVLSAFIVVGILWLALRSWRLVAAVGATVAVGLATTAALGLWLVGPLNPISVAFAVLFVGLGADFAIQYSVRYRAERHDLSELAPSLVAAARTVGTPLTLAAAAAAVGFLSFLPTDYRGLAELGLIAGCGMLVAFLAAMTLLPALLRWLKPPPELQPLGYAELAVADRFLQRHRIAVVVFTTMLALAGLPALLHLKFEFDPLGLRNPNSEPIATIRALSTDPRVGPDSAELLASRQAIATLRPKLEALPEVKSTRTVDNFVPTDQDRKLRAIGGAARPLEGALTARQRPMPSNEENVSALRQATQALRDTANEGSSAGPVAARRLADQLTKLADGSADLRAKAQVAFMQTLGMSIDDLKESLQPQRVTLNNLPGELVRDWTAPNRDARLEIVPKGDPNDSAVLRQFASAVLAVAPNATGPAIETYEWGRTMILAFVESAGIALLAIALLLWIVLRRISDVLLTLIPLLVAAVATLEICALSGFALNYANIIALPVLLGVGVAFKIYYVLAWRKGETNFLQSPLTRAVFFSALMTATAFGSLWLSEHPGTSSMGKLLALSLLCALASAALFQPALMGMPRTATVDGGEAFALPLDDASARRRLDMRKLNLAAPRVWSRKAWDRQIWNRIRRRSGSQS